MRRREFITLVGGTGMAWPARGPRAASPVKLPTIGILGTSTEDGRTPRAPSQGGPGILICNAGPRARSSGGPVRQSPLASASAQKEIDETTGKFLRRRGDIANID